METKSRQFDPAQIKQLDSVQDFGEPSQPDFSEADSGLFPSSPTFSFPNSPSEGEFEPDPNSTPVLITVDPQAPTSESLQETPTAPAEENGLFDVRDLQSLSEDGPANSFNQRAGTGGPNPVSVGNGTITTPSPSPSPSPEPLLWYTGQSRGYSMLYLMQREAQAVVETELETLLESRVLEPYIGVLADGTFSWNPSLLESAIRRLNDGERALTLVLILSNGSTMRSYASTEIDAPFVHTPPEVFREAIRFDPSTRDEYRQLARRCAPFFELNRRLNPKSRNIAIPMLEDNLDDDSFVAISELAAQSLPVSVEIVRNPCPGCYEENGLFIYGSNVEIHSLEHLQIYPNPRGFSLDGTSFYHPTEQVQRGLPLSQVYETLRDSLSRGIEYFGLWKFERQGIGGGTLQIPSQRTYVPPTAQEQQNEIALLRFGLREVELASNE
ncbi:MAG: hypothetical protein KDD64_13390 [Bdellovibrionales bacterium]|nr:hypothetical protein [Bdellovibrionales bacterium]